MRSVDGMRGRRELVRVHRTHRYRHRQPQQPLATLRRWDRERVTGSYRTRLSTTRHSHTHRHRALRMHMRSQQSVAGRSGVCSIVFACVLHDSAARWWFQRARHMSAVHEGVERASAGAGHSVERREEGRGERLQRLLLLPSCPALQRLRRLSPPTPHPHPSQGWAVRANVEDGPQS